MKQLQLNTIKPLYDKYGINNNNNDGNDGNNNEDIQERICIHNIMINDINNNNNRWMISIDYHFPLCK